MQLVDGFVLLQWFGRFCSTQLDPKVHLKQMRALNCWKNWWLLELELGLGLGLEVQVQELAGDCELAAQQSEMHQYVRKQKDHHSKSKARCPKSSSRFCALSRWL